MRKLFRIFITMTLLSIMAVSPDVMAQEPANENEETSQLPEILQNIEESSQGNVELIIPETIADKIVSQPQTQRKPRGEQQRNTSHGINKTNGYRIQIFSDGRNQRSLLSRAKARGNAVASRFPKYRGQIYTMSVAPNVYCRVGNFTSQAAASAAMAELKRAFPAFAKEMRIVKSKVVVIK